MLRNIYIEFGAVGTLAVALLLVATVLSWFQAIAGVVVSSMPGALKLGTVFVLSAFPPVSIVVLGIFLFKPASRVRSRTRARRLHPITARLQSSRSQSMTTLHSRLEPAPVYSEVA